MEPNRVLIITNRPINVPLYEDAEKNAVWVRLSKFFVDSNLSPNTASQMAKQHTTANPSNNLFCPIKFQDSGTPEWCVNLLALPSFLQGRRRNSVTYFLWRLLDAWNEATAAEALSEAPPKKESEPTLFESVERGLKIQSVSDLNFSVNAFNC